MPEKRVLVIEGDYKSVTELPGKLLAEFEGYIQKRGQGGLYVPEFKVGTVDNPQGWSPDQPVHVLMLHVPTCPDERGTKEGEEK